MQEYPGLGIFHIVSREKNTFRCIFQTPVYPFIKYGLQTQNLAMSEYLESK